MLFRIFTEKLVVASTNISVFWFFCLFVLFHLPDLTLEVVTVILINVLITSLYF